jgi:hypothetical protein
MPIWRVLFGPPSNVSNAEIEKQKVNYSEALLESKYSLADVTVGRDPCISSGGRHNLPQKPAVNLPPDSLKE